jgi:hypothetical protein
MELLGEVIAPYGTSYGGYEEGEDKVGCSSFFLLL